MREVHILFPSEPACVESRLPAWPPQASGNSQPGFAEDITGSPEEVRGVIRDRLEAAGITIPSVEEAKALFPEAISLQMEADAVVRMEQERGWGLDEAQNQE